MLKIFPQAVCSGQQLAQNRAGNGLGERPVIRVPILVALRVKRRNPRECGSSSGFRQVFVALKADGNSDFGFSTRRRLGSRFYDPQNMAPASYRHALSESDFRRHAKSDLDFGAFLKRGVCEKEDSTRTQILSEPDAFNGS